MKKTKTETIITEDNKEVVIPKEIAKYKSMDQFFLRTYQNDMPIVEKLFFCVLSEVLTDEATRVKISKLKGKKTHRLEGMTKEEYIETLYKEADVLDILRTKRIRELVKEIKTKDINIFLNYKDLDKGQKRKANKYFDNRILKSVIDNIDKKPYIESEKTGIIISYTHKDDIHYRIIPIQNINIECRIDDKTYITLEELIKGNIKKIYPNNKVTYVGTFKIIREDVQENTDIKDKISRAKDRLNRAQTAQVTRILVEDKCPKKVSKYLKKLYNVKRNYKVYEGKIYNIKKIVEDIRSGQLDESFPSFIPTYPKEFKDRTIFEAIKKDGPFTFQHPFESHEVILNFLKEASEDEYVKEIAMSLYRVSGDNSKIIDTLCSASDKGKKVSVLCELRARDSENVNIAVTEKLKSHGVNVYQGIDNFKVHAKMIYVKKVKDKKTEYFAHIGTGNYDEQRAKIFVDRSYFTNEKNLIQDIYNKIFLFGIGKPKNNYKKKTKRVYGYKKSIKKIIIALIAKEEKIAKKDKKSNVILKCNGITDKDVVKAIYKASKKGVKFTIICRQDCSIMPNKNITIKALKGRFVEHERIYKFSNGGKPIVLIGSADLMKRNLCKRVELVIQVKDKKCIQKINKTLKLNVKDEVNSLFTNKKGNYEILRSQDQFDMYKELMGIK